MHGLLNYNNDINFNTYNIRIEVVTYMVIIKQSLINLKTHFY